MRRHAFLALLAATAAIAAPIAADDRPFPSPATFTTLQVTPLAIEGLTGDELGNLYTTGRAAPPERCPVWQIGPNGGLIVVGTIGNAAPGCNPSGIRRDRDGNFFIADANQGGVIWKLRAADMNPAAPFATGVPGTNGLAFDRRGNVWTGDGTTGQGRVWRVSPDGKTVTEMFRIQPMRNSAALGGTVAGDGVGRQVRSFPPGTLLNTLGGQDLVANGVDFDRNGDLIVADTARGALWRIRFDGRGNVTSRMGCDASFTADTLCLENVLVAHPLLEGTDGIFIDRAGNIWNAANERNAIVVVRHEGHEGGEGHEGPGAGNAPATRVIAGRADRIRTVAFGVIVDPNISQPLPFAGLSYVDFNLFGTGTQFNGFFGGSYAQVAFSAPSVAGSRWQLAGRAFAIATSYNDRAFEQGREQYELDIRQRPAQAAVWALRPIGARAAVRIEYDWDFNAFGAGEQTAAGFVIPRDQNAHALRLGLDLQRNGWQGSIWGSYARRVGWRAWGELSAAGADGSCTTCAGSAQASFTRYGASVLRSQAISTRVAARIEGAVMGGHDLDRFSRYAFGTFDNRLHGYPAALVRYDRGAVLRTAIAWTAGRAVRLDGFADTAVVRDPGFGRGLRNYTGFGAALEAPAPFRTLLSIEWGYGLQGVDTTGGRGTNVVRIAAYKVF